MMRTRRSIVMGIFTMVVASLPARSQQANSICDEIAKLNSDAHQYLWPRWQDDQQMTPVDQEILRLRAKAIPILIGCLADERKTMVFGTEWGQPSVGMVAFSMLGGLFTACNHYEGGYGVNCHNSIKGPITWDDLCKEGPSDVVYPCWAGWEEHLKKYGPRSIQESWQRAWTENKDRIYWDQPGKCFRIKKTP